MLRRSNGKRHRELASFHALAFPTAAIFSLSFAAGIALPATPGLIRSIAGTNIEQAAVIGGYMLALFAGCQLLASPMLGRLSDSIGRRPVLLISVAACCTDYLVISFANNLAWLFVARAVSGVFSGVFAVSFAVAVDVRSKETLAGAFGILGAAEGAGYLLGAASGGFLTLAGDRAPFVAAAFCLLAVLIYGLVFFKETLSKPQRPPRAFPLKRMVRAIGKVSEIWPLAGLLLSMFLLLLSRQVMPSVWPYYTIAQFGWSPTMVGISIAIYGAIFTFSQLWIVVHLCKVCGEFTTARIGLLIAAVASLGIALAPVSELIFVWLILAALSGIALSAIRSILSNRVPLDGQGQLQGLIGSIGGLSTLIGVPFLTNIFHLFSSGYLSYTFYGAPFLAAALTLALSFLALLCSQTSKRP